MGIFGFRKKRTVDLTKYSGESLPIPKKDFKFEGDSIDLREEISTNTKSINTKNVSTPFSFLDSESQSNPSLNLNTFQNVSPKDIANQLRNLTGRIEDTSNDLYKLLHRIELLERKIERFESKVE